MDISEILECEKCQYTAPLEAIKEGVCPECGGCMRVLLCDEESIRWGLGLPVLH